MNCSRFDQSPYLKILGGKGEEIGIPVYAIAIVLIAYFVFFRDRLG